MTQYPASEDCYYIGLIRQPNVLIRRSDEPEMLKHLEVFCSSWRFPTFVIAFVLGYEFMLFGLLLLPSKGSLAEFAEEFRISCFGYDPASGMVEWIVVVSTFSVPLIVVLVVSIVWLRELVTALQTKHRAVAAYAGVGAALSLVTGVALAAVSNSPGQTPFPAEALRTEFLAPEFELRDQTERTIRLADLRGNVVLVTAIFSRCGYSCPQMLNDVQDVVKALTPEQVDELRIAVITLDPQNDTPEVLAKVAEARGFTSPPYHLLTGEPASVEKILDDFAVPRSRDAGTGQIDHANLFILLDRQGRIAYRFNLGERQKGWLLSALQLLLTER